MRTSYIVALGVLLANVVAAAIYWPGLHGGFFFDDGPSILRPEGVRLEAFSTESLRQALHSGGAGPSGRPVAQLSFALNYYFAGFDPFAFKASNLAIHLASGLLVFWLAIRLLTAATPQTDRRKTIVTSIGIGTLWLLHPMQLLPVLHVVQRMTSLSAFFLLAALLMHIAGREHGGRAGTMRLVVGWAIFWPLSFFSKETGALFPLFALAWELILRRSTCGGLDRFARGFAAVMVLALAVGIAYAFSPGMQWLWAGYDLRPFSLVERILTEGRVLWFYLGLILAPRLEAFGLYHDDIDISTGAFSPWTTMPALAGVLGLIWLAWRTRARAPVVSFGLAWFLIGHAMESTVLPLEIAHEHRNYVPLFGILLAGAWVLLRGAEQKGVPKTAAITLAAAALVYFPFVTALRSLEFGDDGRRTQIEAQHHRLSAHAQFDAGSLLADLPQSADPNSPSYTFARRHYELAGRLDPNFKISWLGLIYLNCRAGQPVDPTWIDALSRRLRETPFAPADRNVLYDLKEMSIAHSICLARWEMETLFAAAFSNPTVSPFVLAMLYSWYADYLLLRENDHAAAQEALAKSLRLAPGNPSNQLKSAQLALLDGRKAEALQMLKALRGAQLSTDEKRTTAKLVACLEGDRTQCGKI